MRAEPKPSATTTLDRAPAGRDPFSDAPPGRPRGGDAEKAHGADAAKRAERAARAVARAPRRGVGASRPDADDPDKVVIA